MLAACGVHRHHLMQHNFHSFCNLGLWKVSKHQGFLGGKDSKQIISACKRRAYIMPTFIFKE